MQVNRMNTNNNIRTNTPTFKKLIIQDNVGPGYKKFPDKTLSEVVHNKEIQKIVAEYQTLGKDIYASCYEEDWVKGMDTIHLSDKKGIPGSKGNGNMVASVPVLYLDSFQAEPYLKRPQALRYLDVFNKSLVEFNAEISKKIDNYIENDVKNILE